jgi:hypothetical protein
MADILDSIPSSDVPPEQPLIIHPASPTEASEKGGSSAAPLPPEPEPVPVSPAIVHEEEMKAKTESVITESKPAHQGFLGLSFGKKKPGE